MNNNIKIGLLISFLTLSGCDQITIDPVDVSSISSKMDTCKSIGLSSTIYKDDRSVIPQVRCEGDLE